MRSGGLMRFHSAAAITGVLFTAWPDGGECFHIHAMLQGGGCKGLPQIMEPNVK